MKEPNDMISVVLLAAARLLPNPQAAAPLRALPISRATQDFQNSFVCIALPDWAQDLVPLGQAGLWVPSYGAAQTWESYDWWRGAYDLLNGTFERAWEKAHEPIHSYSFRLPPEKQIMFDHAWVNRIVLFLRRWAVRAQKTDETTLFGPLPKARIHLTHDVDAVRKTFVLRLKAAAFALFNAARKGDLSLIKKAARFLWGPGDYDRIEEVRALEERYGLRSTWNLYGGKGGLKRSPASFLFDPGYDVTDPSLRSVFRALADGGHRLGLHPSFAAWRDAAAIEKERFYAERALGLPLTRARQHWLRFSFAETWQAQAKAGLKHDMTLGFNDRPGFRSSAALTYRDAASGLTITPLVLMDSHLYDYRVLSSAERKAAIDGLLKELTETAGEASVLWHPHTFDPDFGWGESYAYLLQRIRELEIETA